MTEISYLRLSWADSCTLAKLPPLFYLTEKNQSPPSIAISKPPYYEDLCFSPPDLVLRNVLDWKQWLF